MLDLIWLIPVVPVVTAGVLGLLGARFIPRRLVGPIACAAVLASFVLSLGAVLALAELPDANGHRVSLGAWIVSGPVTTFLGNEAELSVDWAFRLDALSGLMS